jgi:hypothetical protein
MWKHLNEPIFRVTDLRREMIDCYSILALGIAMGLVIGLMIH